MVNLLIFDTHPIPYRAPVFRALIKLGLQIKVIYFDPAFDSSKWWFHERGMTPKQVWGLPLEEGYPSFTIESRKEGGVRSFLAFRRNLKQERPEAVLIYGYYQLEHWMLLLLSLWCHIPILFIGENFSHSEAGLFGWIRGRLRRLFFAKVRLFISIGDKNEDYYSSLGVPPNRIVRSKYCADADFFDLSPEAKESHRTKWRSANQVLAHEFVVLFIGRLFDRKRPLDVVQLARTLSSNNRPVRFFMIGNGPDETKLSEAVQGLPNVTLLGFQPPVRVREALCGADLLYVPSEYETWGLVANEALALGVPALVTETCGVARDLVVPGKTGECIPVGDIEAAAHFIERILLHPEEWQRLSVTAQAKAKEYHPDRLAADIVRAVRSVSKPQSDSVATVHDPV